MCARKRDLQQLPGHCGTGLKVVFHSILSPLIGFGLWSPCGSVRGAWRVTRGRGWKVRLGVFSEHRVRT